MADGKGETAASTKLRMLEEKIGTVAGQVWHALKANGPMSWQQVAKVTGLSSDAVQRGIGWLAREGKLAGEDDGKGGERLRLR